MMASQSTEICSQANAHNFAFGKSCLLCNRKLVEFTQNKKRVFTRDLNCTLINRLCSIALEICLLLKGQAVHDVQSCHMHALHSRQIGNTITYCTVLPCLGCVRLRILRSKFKSGRLP